MKLWIMRHGFAGDFIPNDTKAERNRPLKPEGKAMVKAIAQAMIDADEIPNVIFASPFERTKNTADIVGSMLLVQVNIVDDMAPNRPLEERLLEFMGHKEQKRIMLVGHVDNTTPAFENFGGDWEPLVMAEVRRVKIDRKSGEWTLKWGVKPSDLGLNDYETGGKKDAA